MLSDKPAMAMLPATDLDRARAFYRDTLGFRERLYNEAGRAVIFDAGDGTGFGIYERPTPTTADHTALSFDVDDIAAQVAELRSRGVVFEEYDLPGLKTTDFISDRAGVKAAWFKDTEGNIVGIRQLSR